MLFFFSQRVMNEVYKLISHIYLKHLVRTSHSKLTKRWSPDVGQAVTEDAELLHNTISNLVRSSLLLVLIRLVLFVHRHSPIMNSCMCLYVLCCVRLLVSNSGTSCC